MFIKIYGERNTGTHYLMQLLLNHLDVIEKKGSLLAVSTARPHLTLPCPGELGWKHRLASKEFLQEKGVSREMILIVTLTKNPYSWLLSLNKRSYTPVHFRAGVRVKRADGTSRRRPFVEKCFVRFSACFGRRAHLFLARFRRFCIYENLQFSDFIRAKWFTEFHEGRDEGFKNAIELWNEKNKAYIELAKDYDVLLLTYEELLASPEAALRKITDRLGCHIQEFNNVHAAAKKEDKGKNYQHYRDYYLEERWREKLSPQDIQWISAQLDPAVMKAFGYNFL